MRQPLQDWGQRVLLIPIGHDQTRRHFPWVTAALIALCTLVQLIRFVTSPSEERLYELWFEQESLEAQVVLRFADSDAVDDQMMAALQSAASDAERYGLGNEFDPNVGAAMMAMSDQEREELLTRFRGGDLVNLDDPLYERLMEVDAELDRYLKNDLAQTMGYRPSSGLSINLVLSAFVHGGWMHLLGNMLFLWLVGCNLEDRWGRSVFAAMYLVGGAVASLAYALVHPGSDIPLIGASGAVAAAMGAFLVCFATAEIRYFYYFWSLFSGPQKGTFDAPAFVAFPLWFITQLWYAWIETYMHLGVAYSAHVGGFLFGIAVAVGLKYSGIEATHLLPATAKGVEWTEDPEYLQARELIVERRADDAVPLLEAVLQRTPGHPGATHDLYEHGVATRQEPLVQRTASDRIAELRRTGDTAGVTRVYTRLVEGFPGVQLSERALFDVAKAAAEVGPAALLIHATRSLITSFPQSPLIPGCLWEVAGAQEREGRPDLATKTLQRLTTEHPYDPFADQARRKLEQLSSGEAG